MPLIMGIMVLFIFMFTSLRSLVKYLYLSATNATSPTSISCDEKKNHYINYTVMIALHIRLEYCENINTSNR